MKRVIFFVIGILILGCSSDDDKSKESILVLTEFNEPDLNWNRNRDDLIEEFGEPSYTSSYPDFQYWEELEYQSDQDGIFSYNYIIDASYNLRIINVNIISSEENFNFISGKLEQMYGTPDVSDSERNGKTYKFTASNKNVSLVHDYDYTDLHVVYSKN